MQDGYISRLSEIKWGGEGYPTYSGIMQDTATDDLDSLYDITSTETYMPPPPAAPTGAGAYGIPLASAGTDLGGVTSSTVSVNPSGTLGGAGNTLALASLFSGLAQTSANLVKQTSGPQAVGPGTYYNPATGTYTTVPASVLGTISSSSLLIIGIAALVLIFALKK